MNQSPGQNEFTVAILPQGIQYHHWPSVVVRVLIDIIAHRLIWPGTIALRRTDSSMQRGKRRDRVFPSSHHISSPSVPVQLSLSLSLSLSVDASLLLQQEDEGPVVWPKDV